MYRQRSLLSFLSKPSPGNQNPSDSNDIVTLRSSKPSPENQNTGDAAYIDSLHHSKPLLGKSNPGDSSYPDVFRQPKPLPEIQNSESSYLEMLRQRRKMQFPTNHRNQNLHSGEHSGNGIADNLLNEIKGTETPPEKLPNRPLSSRFLANGDVGGQSLASMVPKFVIDDELEVQEKRDHASGGPRCFQPTSAKTDEDSGAPKQRTHFKPPLKGDSFKFHQPTFIDIENVDDLSGPETPANCPLVPRLKRIQEDHCNLGDKDVDLLHDPVKRRKIIQESMIEKKSLGELSENTSKFEWLNPSLIRDADGRRPSDVLYNKKTLYIPPEALKKMSASQKQYWTSKSQYMDTVLFFKVGKFYELYELDAEIGHRELDWKITVSGVGKCRQVGVSESGIDDAVQKLVSRGYKVGRIEQMETADRAKARGSTAVIQRKLVHVFTPSTSVNDNMEPNAVHLLALKEGNFELERNGSTVYGFAFFDCAALKFWVGSICDDASSSALGALLLQVSPKEVLFENRGISKETHKALKKYASAGSTMLQLSPMLPGVDFLDTSDVEKLIHAKGYFKGSCNSWTSALDGLTHKELTIIALGGLVNHLSRLMLDDALRNGDIFPYQVYKSCLRIDGQTLVNLEIFNNTVDGGLSGTLYKHLDSCITSSGKRLLRNWICHPLQNIGEINDRLDVVEELMEHSEIMFLLAQYLCKLPDLERLLGQVKASVGSLAVTLLPLIGEKVLKQRVKKFVSLINGIATGMELLQVLEKENNGSKSLSKFLHLPQLTGDSGLVELLTQLEEAVNDNFPQFQDNAANGLNAETLSVLVDLFFGKVAQWSQIIHALNCIDVLRSFAAIASSSGGSMCRPSLLPANSSSLSSGRELGGPVLKIKGLWHPYAVGESGNTVVPNDIQLGEDTTGYKPRTLLLTGPNMGGKSTLLRATCLAVIMAQLGCYVPGEMCVLSPADTIFTRLGATDRIMSGESTFFVECSETASILQHATQDSLVILDELGRGTSTFDGYAIAYAVFRHLIEKTHCRMLFATHYHPLTKEFASHPHVSLQHMSCIFKPTVASNPGNCLRESSKQLVFLYKLASGACPESYGLEVALMAGIPKQMVEAAARAGSGMKISVGESFKSSEEREGFSTLHEEWLRCLLELSRMGESGKLDEDGADTLLCLWHELQSFYGSVKNRV